MRITLDLKKSLEENAQEFFQKAKKLRKKLEGAKEAIEIHKKRLEDLKKKESQQEERKQKRPRQEKIDRQWYEKFKWFISSEGFLCVAGTDATSNETVVKKYMDPSDVVFHTDMAGSPFVIVKVEKTAPGAVTLDEAAQFTLAYSRAWKKGMATIEVFHVNPEQVSKQANPGEHLPKGAFMIRGKVNYLRPSMEICVGVAKDGVHAGRIIAGSRTVMEKHSRVYAVIVQGRNKSAVLAKQLMKKFDITGSHNLDDLIKFIPAGGADISETKKLKV